MMDWVDGQTSLMMVVMVVLTILLVVGLIVGINALYPSRGEGPSRGQGDRPPATHDEPRRTAAEEELELRYARGEIDAETLARQRAVLRQR